MSTSTGPTTTLGMRNGNGRSRRLLARASEVTPGGLNSAGRKIDPTLAIATGDGAYLVDVDGNRYIDAHAAYGAILLGHSFEPVDERVRGATRKQGLFGVGPTEDEVLLAEKLVAHIPSAEQVVLCGSGSEATFHAIRLARAITGRERILKFQGCYHGWHDYVLRNVMSEPDRVGTRDPVSPGMLDAAVDATLVCRYNDLDSVRTAFRDHADEIAAVIVEPIAHNAPTMLPIDGFLEGLRKECAAAGALLIFDEVITGIRHALGGYQSICGVVPDISCFAKAIANGYPLAAIAGPKAHLDRFNTSPRGDVWYAGTFNGGAAPVAAALATIDLLETEPVHEHLSRLGQMMRDGLTAVASDLDVPAVVLGYGSIYVTVFMEGPVKNYEDTLRNDRDFFTAYRQHLMKGGLLEMPSIGRSHISYSHTERDIELAVGISRSALQATLEERGLPQG